VSQQLLPVHHYLTRVAIDIAIFATLAMLDTAFMSYDLIMLVRPFVR
jgi:hypothetical protein